MPNTAGQQPPTPKPTTTELVLETYHIRDVLFDNVAWIAVHAETGRIVYASDQAARLLGYDSMLQVTRLMTDDLLADGQREARSIRTAALAMVGGQDQAGIELTLQAKRRDGTTLPVVVGLYASDRMLQKGYVVAVIHDMTARRPVASAAPSSSEVKESKP